MTQAVQWMAGYWTKMTHELPDKPEVIAISARLNTDRDSVVGKLHRIWTWFDQHTVDGHAPGVTPAFLDQHVALDGFALALESVGWLSIRNNGISMPNFDRHCSKSAKERALACARKGRSRHASTVTKPGTEQSRAEDKKKETKEKKKAFQRPSVEEVKAYCLERSNGIDPQQFVDHYEARGWLAGKVPMRDWQAAVRTWENNRNGTNGKPRLPTAEEDAAWRP